MPQAAHLLLRTDAKLRPAWAMFDRGWYLHHYPDARALCVDAPEAAALEYYLQVGARLGHSPSPLFDEAYYLASNPDVAALVRAGQYASGFDHYCQHGWRGVSPHWLFDDALYAELYDDMSLENLELHGCCGRYDHYLRSGQREARVGHYLFDAPYYRDQALAASCTIEEIDGPGPYVHFLACLGSGRDELAPSIYFDPAWYVEQHPAAKQAILRGDYLAALHHYLTNDTSEMFDPVPQFSERFYRQRYPDIDAAIAAGLYRNAYQQFVQHGCFELRQPSAEIDLAYYRDMHRSVRDALNAGLFRDAFAHFRRAGLAEGLAYNPPVKRPGLEEYPAREGFIRKARADLALFARQGLDFSFPGAPEVAVIMVAYGRFELTMRSLASLRQNFGGKIQLILVDNASEDDTLRIEQYVRGMTLLRNPQNVGFLKACNQALAHVAAPCLLYLNNDVALGFGAVASAMARLSAAADIGAVCGKIVRTHGCLQEAGSIIWDDGTTTGYLRGESPLAPGANFVRDVDYGSAVFLLCRTALVKALAGFDEAFMPAYYEDADLCVRMLQAGYRIVYDPAISVEHLEFGSAVTPEASMALMRRGRRIFRERHKAFLQAQPSPGRQTPTRARERGGRPKLLFIEDTVPLRRLGSGFVRSNDIVHAIDRAGYDVHVFPMNGAPYDVMSLLGDMPARAEVLYDRAFSDIKAFLSERRGVYQRIWVARTHNLRRLRSLLIEAGNEVPVILDTEALASCRAATKAAMTRTGFDLDTALQAEFAGFPDLARIIAVNQAEAQLLQRVRGQSVEILGTCREATPTKPGFAARSGLLFIGAVHEAGAPNADSLDYYTQEIFPVLAQASASPPLLTVAGYCAPGIETAGLKTSEGVRALGEVAQTRPLYEAARIFVAPTRFAAGTPYKVYEAAAHGVPCIVTTLLAEQLGWRDGEEVLAVPTLDAEAFAGAILRLDSDEALWTRLRANALKRLRRENGVAAFQTRVQQILAL